MRLIDADVADKWMQQNNAFIDSAILKAIPTIDAVPVVRCRECKYLIAVKADNGDAMQVCNRTKSPVCFDDFCSYGEKAN